MKFLKWLLIVLATVFVAFVLIGWLNPVHTSRAEVTVDAKPEQAFAVMNNPALLDRWLYMFKRVENLSGAPNEVGSRWKLVFEDESGGEMEMLETVTAFEAGEHFAFDYDTDWMTGYSDTRFTEQNGKTLITMEQEFRGKNLWKNAMLTLSGPKIDEINQQNLDSLKQLVEASSVSEEQPLTDF